MLALPHGSRDHQEMCRGWLVAWCCALWLMLPGPDVLAAQAACSPDEQLSRAAAELLLAHHERPSAAQLTAAVRGAGSDAVGLHARFIPQGSGSDGTAGWLASLRERIDGVLSCGRAEGESGTLVIAFGRAAGLEPIDPRSRVVRGSLGAGFHDAELVLAAADGQLVRLAVGAAALREGVSLPGELPLPLEVQLVARGPTGPRPVAERTLGHAGGVSSARLAFAQGDGAEPLDELVLALRAARGRSALRNNRLLREAAAAHAREVCASGRVAHELERGEGPERRLAHAGLSARVLGEAIARAEGSRAALLALQQSPSHLYTLLDPRFTDFGVGVAQDDSQKLCYVVLLCAWPRYVGRVGKPSARSR